jgi:2-aminoadipate transaminase
MIQPEQLSAMAQRALNDPIADIFNAVMPRQAADPSFISLAAGPPQNQLLPNDLLPELLDAARTADKRQGLLNYTMPQGLPLLRAGFAALLGKQGVACSPEGMLITSGGMEAISLAAQLTLNPGDTVLVESPAFPGAIATFKQCGAKVVHLTCDEEGLRPDALEKGIAEHKPRLVSLMPDYQNPSGWVMPAERRQQIADILKATGTLAIEDGVYSLLRFEGEALPPLQSYAPEHVMYAASVSKILAPAMRVGCLVAPRVLLERASAIKSSYNMQASGFTQAITERFLNPDAPYLDKQLATLRETYKKRRDVMVQALHEHLPESADYIWTNPNGGMFLWLEGPAGTDFTQLFLPALDNGVAFIPGLKFYADSAYGKTAARLNFASTPEEDIPEGIRRLGLTLTGKK